MPQVKLIGYLAWLEGHLHTSICPWWNSCTHLWSSLIWNMATLYGIHFWKKDIELLESVQHRVTRMIPALRNLPYEDRLWKMDLPSLAYRRLRGDAIETYMYRHGIYNADSSALLPLADESEGVNTRGHSLKLLKRNCKKSIRGNVLGFRIVNVWNSLPEDVVNASSVNAFKELFDRHCVQKRLMSDVEEESINDQSKGRRPTEDWRRWWWWIHRNK